MRQVKNFILWLVALAGYAGLMISAMLLEFCGFKKIPALLQKTANGWID